MPIYMPASPNFTRCRFGLETNTQRFESPLTRAVQRKLLQGSRWRMDVTLPGMDRRQMAAWQAFFLQLEGSVNTFYASDPDARAPRGPATGAPLVNGANQTGSTLNIDGCTPNVTGWMRAGDYFSWASGELKMLTSDANTNGSGQAALNFKPAIRTSPADNAALVVRDAACAMILADDMQAMWETGKRLGVYEPLSFTALEVFT